VGYFCHFQKLLKVNNRPLGENSPNQVTLAQAHQNSESDRFGLLFYMMLHMYVRLPITDLQDMHMPGAGHHDLVPVFTGAPDFVYVYLVGRDMRFVSVNPSQRVMSSVARWFIFKPKIKIWINFGGPYFGKW
jgi:hypothetical protein